MRSGGDFSKLFLLLLIIDKNLRKNADIYVKSIFDKTDFFFHNQRVNDRRNLNLSLNRYLYQQKLDMMLFSIKHFFLRVKI